MYLNYFSLGILIVFISCLTDVSCQQEKCLGVHNYCSGQFGDMKAICKDGYCYCTGQDYDYYNCLPDAYGCRIEVNTATALAKPRYNNQQPNSIYSCTPGNSSYQYEVHVLTVYEGNRHTRPPTAGDTNVNIVSSGKSDRPIILVLGSYEPVNWILNLPSNITISKVILVAYYLDQSSVSGDVNQVQAVERKTWQWGMGYGSDSGGGDTVALLKQVYDRYGVVTSFTGTYKADNWTLALSSPRGQSSLPSQSYIRLSEAIKKLTKTVKRLTEEVESQHKRIGALELEQNRRSQFQQIAEHSSSMSTYMILEKLLGFLVITIMITEHYVW